jgi:hypothetical protein
VTLEPEFRPLLLGLFAAIGALGVLLVWPPRLWRDAAWAGLILVVAVSFAWFERRMAGSGRPLKPIRWVAAGLAAVALVELAWLAWP